MKAATQVAACTLIRKTPVLSLRALILLPEFSSIPHTSRCGGAEPRVAVQRGARSCNGATRVHASTFHLHWAKGASDGIPGQGAEVR